jgi:hypothetical protein
MTTSVTNVPAGTTSQILAVNTLTSVLAGPVALGGTTTLSFSRNPSGPFLPWSFGASINPQSFRPLTTGYIQVTAATAASNVAICDMSGVVGNRTRSYLMSINETFASGSSTAEQTIGSLRLAPGVVPLNARLRLVGNVDMTDGGNAKTLQVRVSGIAGTVMFQSAALASLGYFNFDSEIAFCNDGTTIKGFMSGAGTAGAKAGWGGITGETYPTVTTINYLNTEVEVVVSCTKATGTDIFRLQGLTAELIA